MEKNKVAIRYYMTIPHVVSVRGKEYAFQVRNAICLGFVDEEDVDIVLKLRRRKCCNESSYPEYRIASEREIKFWLGEIER